VGPTKCFPFQHAVNAVAGVLLGPWWAAAAAFVASVIRNMLGTGTLFAFPGSIPGALAVGLAWKLVGKDLAIPGLEPHVYSQREYRQMGEVGRRMEAGGIVVYEGKEEG